MTPTRTCVGCKRLAEQDELLRVVASPDGNIHVGRSLPGRGAWLCAASLADCLEKALHRGALSRALRVGVDPMKARQALSSPPPARLSQ